MSYLLEIEKHQKVNTTIEYNNLDLAIERARELRSWFGWTCVVWDSKGNVLDC
jgi:hypothetical protein